MQYIPTASTSLYGKSRKPRHRLTAKDNPLNANIR